MKYQFHYRALVYNIFSNKGEAQCYKTLPIAGSKEELDSHKSIIGSLILHLQEMIPQLNP